MAHHGGMRPFCPERKLDSDERVHQALYSIAATNGVVLDCKHEYLGR